MYKWVVNVKSKGVEWRTPKTQIDSVAIRCELISGFECNDYAHVCL